MTNINSPSEYQVPQTIKGYVPPLPGLVPGPADLQNALAGWAQRELAKQSWWRKSANTVVTFIGGLSTLVASLAAFLATQETGVPSWMTFVVAAVGFLGTVVGVKNTKNGLTYQGAAQVQQAVLDPAVLGTVQRVLAQEPYPMQLAESAIDKAAEESRNWIATTGNGVR